MPAYVVGRRLDLLGSNRLARAALFTDFDALPAQRRNVAWLHFLDQGVRGLYPDAEAWAETARDAVAALRVDLGPHLCDDRLCDLLGELSVRSADFRQGSQSRAARASPAGAAAPQRSGVGNATGLRRPERPTARTPKKTLSLESARV
ncbi:hypothetical protein [Streptomyces sp. NPDC017940]|uniref:MmyB family transcriptional regulator n=1 Tax=Streptomyces sp. NPDC017940 TaxID=3365017 RepID=UPI003787E7D7